MYLSTYYEMLFSTPVIFSFCDIEILASFITNDAMLEPVTISKRLTQTHTKRYLMKFFALGFVLESSKVNENDLPLFL